MENWRPFTRWSCIRDIATVHTNREPTQTLVTFIARCLEALQLCACRNPPPKPVVRHIQARKSCQFRHAFWHLTNKRIF